jgi:hypothetical protein
MKIGDSTKNSVVNRNQVFLKHLVSVILWTALFTLAYAQSSLYTSNQNQYFLHGLAKAGFGYLSQDWLANTLDPTPVFSGLVYLTGSVLPWSPIFYVYYSILAGIYLFSLYGILSEIFYTNGSQAKRWLTLTALLLIHSAAIRYIIVRIFNQGWAHLFDGGVAGQRLLGSVLQPSAFGVLLVLSIFLYLRRKTTGAIISLVLAATIHPTYLLSAATLTLVYMGITFSETKRFRSPLTVGIAALLGVVPILIHAFLTFGGTGPVLVARSQKLLVDFRIPHHAIPAEWFDGSVIIKTAFILLALYLTRKTRLFHILFWPFAVAVLGTLAQILTNSDVLALLFPWRMSTWLVPLSVGAVGFWVVELLWPWLDHRVSPKIIMVASMILVTTLAGTGLSKSIWEYHEKTVSNNRPMMAFISENKSPGDVYLIPLDMQDFRLETGVSAYVEFKSIPYKDVEVIEWHRRVRVAGSLYRAPIKRTGCKILADLYVEGVTHVVLPDDHTVQNCSNLDLLYLDGYYAVFVVTGE